MFPSLPRLICSSFLCIHAVLVGPESGNSSLVFRLAFILRSFLGFANTALLPNMSLCYRMNLPRRSEKWSRRLAWAAVCAARYSPNRRLFAALGDSGGVSGRSSGTGATLRGFRSRGVGGGGAGGLRGFRSRGVGGGGAGGAGGLRGFRSRGLGGGGGSPGSEEAIDGSIASSSAGSASSVGSTSSAGSVGSAFDSITGGSVCLGLFLLPGGLPRPLLIGSSGSTGIGSPGATSAIGI